MRLSDVGRVLHGPVDAEGWLCRKRPENPGGQVELEPAM